MNEKFNSCWRHKLLPYNYPKQIQFDLSMEYTFKCIFVTYMWDRSVIEIIKVKYDMEKT